VPYVLADLCRRLVREGRPPLGPTALKDNRVYVACQTNDDIPYVIRYVGDDNLVIGSDYGHADTSSEIEALRHLSRAHDLSPGTGKRILDDNPRALYGL
jgi:hypothetical protein